VFKEEVIDPLPDKELTTSSVHTVFVMKDLANCSSREKLLRHDRFGEVPDQHSVID
jgi:hypothetical protein